MLSHLRSKEEPEPIYLAVAKMTANGEGRDGWFWAVRCGIEYSAVRKSKAREFRGWGLVGWEGVVNYYFTKQRFEL